MLVMTDYGLSLRDAEFLAEFEEIGWFLDELEKRTRRRNYAEMLNQAEVFRMAEISNKNKKGYSAYNRWFSKLQRKTRVVEEAQETVFDRIRKIKPKTIFDRLKEK